MRQQRSLAQGGPRLGCDAALGVHLAQFFLGETWMQFDLVDRRHDAYAIDENREVLGLEIADADGPDTALVAQVGEGLEGIDELIQRGLWPVDQIEVEILETEPVHA